MFVMVWFYYISNIWKNQVFLKNRSPDFLLSPFFAQCECAVTRGTAAAKGKRAAAQESPLSHCAWRNASSPKGSAFHAVPSGEWGPRLQGKTRLRKCCSKPCFAPVRFSRAGAKITFFILIILTFLFSVHPLFVRCSPVVRSLFIRCSCAVRFSRAGARRYYSFILISFILY